MFVDDAGIEFGIPLLPPMRTASQASSAKLIIDRKHASFCVPAALPAPSRSPRGSEGHHPPCPGPDSVSAAVAVDELQHVRVAVLLSRLARRTNS